MARRRGVVGVVSLVVAMGGWVAVASGQRAATPVAKKGAGFAEVGSLHAEVAALQVIRALRASPTQLEAIRTMAPKTMQEEPPRKLVKVSDRYRKALRGLREALLSGDEEAIEDHFATVDELGEKERIELDELELTDEARKQAPKVVAGLSARQVAEYLVTVANFPDPFEEMAAALEASRELTGLRWEKYREEVAYLCGWLMTGVDAKKEAQAREAVSGLLNKSKRLSDREFRQQREALRKEARALVGGQGPTDVIRHYMERTVAELLSNHRLTAAVRAWSAKK